MSRYAAKSQPVVLLPGVNHSSLSNGEVREGSGDLSPEVSLADANDAVGGAMADFLTANFCSNRSVPTLLERGRHHWGLYLSEDPLLWELKTCLSCPEQGW